MAVDLVGDFFFPGSFQETGCSDEGCQDDHGQHGGGGRDANENILQDAKMPTATRGSKRPPAAARIVAASVVKGLALFVKAGGHVNGISDE